MTEMILFDLERKINNNYFKSKNELIKYIELLRKNPQIDANIFNKKVKRLLDLYDKLNTTDLSLNMDDYKDVRLDSSNYIVSSDEDKVLKTNGNHGDLSKEFKSIQNEMVANNKDGKVNADMVFDHMEEYKKESSSLMPLSNLNVSIINREMLDKIRFFIGNQNINIFDYKVDINNGFFFNTVTDELFEVRRNPQTLKYEIYKGGEAVYKSETFENNNDNSVNEVSDIPELSDEELMKYQARTDLSYEQRRIIEEELERRKQKSKPKTRVLRLNPLDGNRAAFIKSGLLIIIITISSIMCALLLLLLK